MILATAFLEAVDAAIVADQGARFRDYLAQNLANTQADRPNDPTYLGGEFIAASEIGRPCARAIWYSFRWATVRTFTAKALRIFSRGVLEEYRFAAMITGIDGVTFHPADLDGRQFPARIGPIKGKLDGIAEGLPGFPEGAAPIEMKSHGDSFGRLARHGVRETKIEHFVQVQLYLAAYEMPLGLYFASSKENDDLHAEIIEFDEPTVQAYYDRAVEIVTHTIPPRVGTGPAYWLCKFCDHAKICYTGEIVESRAKSCRTCDAIAFDATGAATCGHTGEDLSHKAQFRGCEKHRLTVLR